jgi:mercuric ion binding protein
MNGEFLMSRLIAHAAFWLALIASSSASAGERTITLVVRNMFCADCPYIVKKSLEAVPGVVRAVVSYKDKTAVVSYDDIKADERALTAATTKAGYPSEPKS